MRWWLRPRFVAPAILLVGAWTTYSTCPGCVDRTRANKDCAWTGDTAFAVDMLDVGHQRHLAADAHLAEELAVRHADLETKRRIGVEHHGGLLDDGRFRRECLDRMLQSIERSHAVTRTRSVWPALSATGDLTRLWRCCSCRSTPWL